MYTFRENKVTLIRLWNSNVCSIPMLANLLQDDEYFKEKILLVDIDRYSPSSVAVLSLVCQKANYKLKIISGLHKLSPIDFVTFFKFGSKDKFEYDEKQIKRMQNAYEVDSYLELSRNTIIGFMCMMYFQNYVFIGNDDRIIKLKDEQNLVEQQIKPKLNGKSIFMKNKGDFSFSGSLNSECYTTKFFYAEHFLTPKLNKPFYENISFIGNYNCSILSGKKIKNFYKKDDVTGWEGYDLTLRTGLLESTRATKEGFVNITKKNKTLSHFNQLQDHSKYLDQRLKVIKCYNQVNSVIPINRRYVRYMRESGHYYV